MQGGGSLDKLMHRQLIPLKLKDKIQLLVGISQALVELHSAAIIHGIYYYTKLHIYYYSKLHMY